MSGVNAHALFSVPDLALGDDSTDESSRPPTWRAERHWVAPAAHRLLRSFAWGAAGGACEFCADLSAPNLAYLLDHQVGCQHHHFLSALPSPTEIAMTS